MEKTVDVKLDHILRDYWKDKKHFADLFNGLIFDGKAVIDYSRLYNEDSANEELLSRGDTIKSVERFRDVVKMWAEGTMYVLLGVENQMMVHYAMPVRTMMYDAMNYTEQIKKRTSSLKNNKVKMSSTEYLSGFRKKDKVHPVVTIVLYYGEEEWDGPTSLYDMMEVSEELKPLVPNYTMNLVKVRDVDDSGFKDEDVKLFFKLMKLLEKDKDFDETLKVLEGKSVSRETILAVGAAASSKELLEMVMNTKGDGVNMCTALDIWVADARKEGEQQGREQGREQGIKETLEVIMRIKKGILEEDILKEGYSAEVVDIVKKSLNGI